MKRAKRWLALGLTAMMVMGLAGCGEKAPTGGETVPQTGTQEKESSSSAEGGESSQAAAKDPVTLEWWYRGNGVQKDTETVEAAFNELLKTYPGMEHVTVNLNCYTGADYKNAVILAQSADQQIDILNTVSLDFAEEVGKGTFLPLDDYLASNETLKNELPDWLWELGGINGSTYIVPNYQRAANMMYFVTPKDYMDKYGDIDAMRDVFQKKDRDIDEIAATLEEYCTAVQAGEGKTKYMAPLGTSYSTQYGFMDRYDTIYGKFIKSVGSDKVEHMYMTDDILKAYEISADWYKKGLVHPDILTITPKDFEGANMLNEVSYIYTINNQAGDEEAVSKYYSDSYGFDVYAVPMFTNYYITNTWAAGGNGITAKCKHPDEAMRLIELMTTEEGAELYNLIVYGIEGTHYDKVDDTHIKTLEYDGTQGGVDSSYAAMKWIMGNTFHAYLNQGCKDGENELALEINNSKDNDVSDLMGFSADTTKIATQLEQTTAVTEEYKKTLESGAMKDDWKSYYDDYVNKMKSAGLEDILTELQSQVDAFKAN